MSGSSPARIGLTGGIGSGKSTVAGMFAGLGVPVLNLDAVGHDVLAQDMEVRQAIIERFGESVCDSAGDIDRAILAATVFVDQALTSELNAIIHPAIWRREEAWLAEQAAVDYVIVEAPVLIEAGAVSRMDSVVVVLADQELRRQRIAHRTGYASRFDEIAARQCSDDERCKAADYLITNDGELDGLQRQVERLHEELSVRFGS